MELIYLSEAAIPSRSSNGMQTMRMCAAFAEAGAEVTLVHPKRKRERPEGFRDNLSEFYGVPGTFEMHALRVAEPVLERRDSLARSLRASRFAAFLFPRAAPGRAQFVVYCRSALGALAADAARRFWGQRSSCRAVGLEMHDEPPTGAAWRLLGRVDALVPISDALRTRLLESGSLAADRVWVEHDGVDLGAVSPDRIGREEAKAALDMPPGSGPLVAYAGRVKAGKGVDVLLDAASRLSGSDTRIVIVGKVYEPDYLARSHGNVTFTGFVPPSEVPRYLAAADMLVMPTTEELPYAKYTSPLKLFEYMASGRPVIASDLAVIREVLRDGDNALLFKPGDPASLAAAIERLRRDPSLASRISERAWRDVQEFSWPRRAERILSRLSAAARDGTRPRSGR